MFNLKTSLLALLFIIGTQFTLPAFAEDAAVKEAETKVLTITRNIVKDLAVNKARYKANPAALTPMIKRLVLPFIDFESMSKLTLGKYWRSASASQRTRFINAYREMLIRSYGKAMLQYAGAKIKAGNSVANKKPGYAIVRTTVIPSGGRPIAANYQVRNHSGTWKAYNIEIAGISLITNFRTNFTREVSAKGLDALIARLEKSNR